MTPGINYWLQPLAVNLSQYTSIPFAHDLIAVCTVRTTDCSNFVPKNSPFEYTWIFATNTKSFTYLWIRKIIIKQSPTAIFQWKCTYMYLHVQYGGL